jgi:hypothetical protein
MNKHGLVLVLAAAGLFACSPGPAPNPASVESTMSDTDNTIVAQAVPSSERIEAVIRSYFDRLQAYDYEGMRSLATPNFETIDGGVRLTHPEFEDYVRTTAELGGAVLDFDLSQFNTRIAGDVAYTTYSMSGLGNLFLDQMVLRRSGDEWLIDVFNHSPAELGNPQSVIRQFYHYIKDYNFEGMRAMITPGFSILYAGVSLDWDGFEQRHREEETELGVASTRDQRFMYRLSEFNIEETPDVVYASFRATNPETRTDAQGEEVPVFNTSYHNSFILKREGDGGDLKIHFIGSMPAADG